MATILGSQLSKILEGEYRSPRGFKITVQGGKATLQRGKVSHEMVVDLASSNRARIGDLTDVARQLKVPVREIKSAVKAGIWQIVTESLKGGE